MRKWGTATIALLPPAVSPARPLCCLHFWHHPCMEPIILLPSLASDGAAAAQQQAVAAEELRQDPALAELQAVMEKRVCGSPAVDGYAHVKPECLEDSPTNLWWQQHKPSPDDLDIHIERLADYDGLAGALSFGTLAGLNRAWGGLP